VKNLCLSVLAALDTPEIHALIRDQIDRSTTATDRITAFALYVQSSAPDKLALIERFQAESRENLVAWEAYLAAIGSNTAPDAVGIIRSVAESGAFRIEQANEQRALFGRFAQNRMIALQTPEGRSLFAEILQKLAVTNEFSTVQSLRAFANLDKMEEDYFVPLVAILADLLATLDPEKTPSVYNTFRRLLAGAPRAVHVYETERGPVAGLQ
jgi:aminopeptidase N